MRKRSGIPAHTLMDGPAVHRPRDAARSPIDCVGVEVQGGIEAEVNMAGRPPIAEPNCRSVITGIEVDVDQNASRVVTRQFDIDLLSRCVAMEEKACDEATTRSGPYLR